MNPKAIKFLACGFGSGLAPVAPGTFGTLAGIPISLLFLPLAWFWRLLFILALTALAVYVADRAEIIYQKKDDQRIVIDEIVGFQLTMLPVAITALHLCAGFVLFRIFDILKPFPIKKLQDLPGGWGVVLDDVGAGLYAGALLMLSSHIIKF
ncbi:MAG: phosphatidylglycerophosphatase A [Smithella sp.]